MSMLFRLWPNCFSSDSRATTQTLVEKRDVYLAENATFIDEMAELNKKLQTCFEAVKAANPTLAAALHFTEAPISAHEMSQMLKTLAFATMKETDLLGLSQDLRKVQNMREQLETLLENWERIEANYDKSIADGGRVLTMNEKDIQDLTALLATFQKLPPTCHSSSTLV